MISDLSTNENAAFIFAIPANTFSDPNPDDVLAYTASREDGSALPAWLSFNAASGTFTGTPLSGDVGSLNVKVTATDSGGLSVSDIFDVTVVNVNDAPAVAHAIADQAASEDAPFAFTFAANTFNDIDVGDTLTYSAIQSDDSALPSWLIFDPATHTFSGTPLNAGVGTVGVKVSAADSAGASTFDIFDISVSNTNDAPIVANAIADQSAPEDAAFSFVIPINTFADADAGDTLTYSATSGDGSALPSWLTFDPASRTLSGTPLNDDVGTVSLRILATDSAGASTFDVFDVSVANTNGAPTVAVPLSGPEHHGGAFV
jgi:NADPH-dependent 7-cyano-7-deazaguanine reductase QueF-like protein